MAHKRALFFIAILTIAWGGFVVAAYFVAHKPFAMQIAGQLASLAWTLVITSMLMLNAFMVGRFTLKWLIPNVGDETSSIILAGGIGLGELGLLGFGLVIVGATEFIVLLGIQILLLAFSIWHGELKEIFRLVGKFIDEIKESASNVPLWMKWTALLAFAITFLRTLLPPIDAFDAMLYHLRIPELWIQDGGLEAYNFPHYWFPGLVEGVFLWGLGLGSEIVPQQIHFLWAILLIMLVWNWARVLWGDLPAWWSLIFLISMPSLLLLATWAYTDLALSFFGVAMLYCLWRGDESNDTRWWNLSAIAAGMAMGVKYTSFVMPVSAVLIITFWTFRHSKEWLQAIARFSLISIVTGAVWYLRNWVWMGNPFYPFAFGGTYWDSFRAAAFSGAGTGIGWDWKALISLPLTITLGYQDINYFDGNIGPLFLLALPLALAILLRVHTYEPPQKRALVTIGLFTLLSALFWVYGYITTKNLWQTRLLFPAIIPFAIPAAAGFTSLQSFDTKQFRISVILSGVAALSVFVSLLDASLSVIARNPMAVATGIVTRASYFETYQPGYFSALQIISQTPPNSSIYSLLEPRSYGASRTIQPDVILENFDHDVFLYKDPAAIVNAWQREGYTHVLLSIRGSNLVYENRNRREVLEATLNLLKLFKTSLNGEYALYEIPQP